MFAHVGACAFAATELPKFGSKYIFFFFFANTSLKFIFHSLKTSHFIKAKETHAAMAPIGGF